MIAGISIIPSDAAKKVAVEIFDEVREDFPDPNPGFTKQFSLRLTSAFYDGVEIVVTYKEVNDVPDGEGGFIRDESTRTVNYSFRDSSNVILGIQGDVERRWNWGLRTQRIVDEIAVTVVRRPTTHMIMMSPKHGRIICSGGKCVVDN